MAKVKIELNRAGVRELLRSDGVEAELRRRAERVADAAGPGHRVETSKGSTRARAAVITDTPEAARGEAKDRRLAAAIQAAR